MRRSEEFLNNSHFVSVDFIDWEKQQVRANMDKVFQFAEEFHQHESPKWISVKDDLPPRDKSKRYSQVMCLVRDKSHGIVCRPFNHEHHCWDDEDLDDYYTDAVGGNITHWMPLPESPVFKTSEGA